MDIIKIKDNTFCIDTGMAYIPFYKINHEEIIMLDSGWAKGDREGIDELLEKNNFKVAAIICSHGHIDHVGNNEYLKEKYNCVIAMPAYEALICSSTINLKLFYNAQTLSEVSEHYGSMVCKTDLLITDDQDSITICDIKFKILHTPGHSPEHICIITPDDVAYLGDSIISYEAMKSSKLPYAYVLREDLKSKLKLYDLKCSRYVMAHKGIYNNITKLITDNIEFYKKIVTNVCSVIEEPMTMEDIFKAVIKKSSIKVTSRYRYRVIERLLKSYVEYLDETGIIVLNMEEGFLKYSKNI